MILHDLDAIYCFVMTFFKSCPMAGMTTVDHVLITYLITYLPEDLYYPLVADKKIINFVSIL